MSQRYEYIYRFEAMLADLPPVPEVLFLIRHPAPVDAEQLAELMIDAYRDTIDYEGESLDDARL